MSILKKNKKAAIIYFLAVYYLVIYYLIILYTFVDIKALTINFADIAWILVQRYRFKVHLIYIILLTITNYKYLMNMVKYVIRYNIYSIVILSIYLTLLILFLDTKNIIPYDERVKIFIQPLIGIILYIFIQYFKEEKISNPNKINKKGIFLEGSWGSKLPINNPQSGIIITGLPGSGKTKYVIEPIIYKMIKQGYTGIIYDYDFNTSQNDDHNKNKSNNNNKSYCLSEFAYNCNILNNNKNRFININFQNINKSSQINPVAPRYISDRSKLSQYINTFLINLSPEMNTKNDFWMKNTSALLESIIIYLDNNYPEFCTIPHAILLGLQDIKTLLNTISKDPETALYISPILDALKGSSEQLAGVTANFKVIIKTLLNKNIFWVLSADKTPLNINSKQDPIILTIGNDPTCKDIYSPIIAMIISVAISNMYNHDREKSFIIIDELPTLFIPNLVNIPATARKYGISTVLAIQNQAQLEKVYSPVGAKELFSTFSNHIIGKSSFIESKVTSDMLGRYEKENISKTYHSQSGHSETITKQKDLIIDPQDTMTLKIGQFIGQVSESDNTFFKIKLNPIDKYNNNLNYKKLTPLPDHNNDIDVEKNFNRIKDEVMFILNH